MSWKQAYKEALIFFFIILAILAAAFGIGFLIIWLASVSVIFSIIMLAIGAVSVLAALIKFLEYDDYDLP